MLRELLTRHPGNPILTHNDLPFVCNAVYNPGAVKCGDEYILMPRVENARRDNRLHVARSRDGIRFAIDPEPIALPPHPEGPRWEYHHYDPRITFLEGRYYITYNAQNFAEEVRIGLCVTDDFRTFERRPHITSPWNRNCCLFPEKIGGRYARIERPMNSNEVTLNMVSFSPDLEHWGGWEAIDLAPQTWSRKKWGIGPPPIKTPKGWLIIFHGVFQALADVYRIGVALLDGERPWRVIGQAGGFALTPREIYERVGDVNNCVFCNGAIPEPDGTIKIYYGCADTCISLATGVMDELIEACLP